MDRIRSIIEIIPGAKLASNVGTELSFQLPIMSSPSFPAVMAQLEASCDALGMISFGIGVTTLEEVFLRVSRDSQGDALRVVHLRALT